MTRPLVSVVIATYNCAQYLGSAIESVLSQTYPHLELHVVNDGSTDCTAEVISRYAGDPRLRYIEQENSGQTAAKNRGIRAARGEFVGFCDADDLWLPDKLEAQLPYFGQGVDVGVVYSRATSISALGEPLAPASAVRRFCSGWVTSDLFKFNFIPFGTALIRRESLDTMGCFDERYRMAIDWDLWLRLSTRYRILFMDRPTYLYRVWDGQMSKNWRGRYAATFDIMNSFLARHPGAVAPRVIREAVADCYVQRARIRALESQEYSAAMVDLLRAVRRRPDFLEAWKSMIFVLAAALGRRQA